MNMSNLWSRAQHAHVGFVLFGLGIVVATIVMLVPGLHHSITDFAGSGPVGLLLNGLLYTIGFTAPLATVIVAETSALQSPWVIGFFGGLGAVTYDSLIFAMTRRTKAHPFFQKIRERFLGRPAVSWILTFTGALIIASPLPDEIGSGILGISNLSAKYFLMLSFVLNGLGMAAIALVAQA